MPGIESDNFDKEVETVFQLKMSGLSDSADIEAKPWAIYGDVNGTTSGYICEKEGSCF